MKIQNAMIYDVTEGFDDENELAVRFKLRGQFNNNTCSFKLANPKDVLRLSILMNYTNSNEFRD